MDKKKLDKWADLLLDTGKRNNLINFRDTRASTAEVLIPTSDVLFKKIDESTSFEVVDPKIIEEDNENGIEAKTADTSDAKAAFLVKYSEKVKRKNQALIYNATGNPITAIKNIYRRARSFIEETGVNVAYLAFGFVHWKESKSSSHDFRAPVLLVPIRIERSSAIEPYFIKPVDDDIVVNPTFVYKMDTEYGIKFPEYHDDGLQTYLKKVEHLVKEMGWTVTSECKIGIFSFLKINMYRDLKDNAAEILANRNVRQLLGETPIIEESSNSQGESIPIGDPLIELHSVVDADSSQIEAIEMAKSGKSFVLQGPPGTGKSQTITNIIAEFLSDGKKVLFVSEKLAALNVVYSKLQQVGLSEFCLQLHSHRANKKDVIADLCHTLQKGRSSVSEEADSEIAIKGKVEHQLDAYVTELHKRRPMIGKSLYQLYGIYTSLRSVPDVKCLIPQILSKGNAYLMDTVLLLEQYVDYIPSIGHDYRKNPWYGYVNQETSYQIKTGLRADLSSVVQFLRELVSLQKEIFEKYGIHCTSIEDSHTCSAFFVFVGTSRLITPSLLVRGHFNEATSELNKLQIQSTSILALQRELSAIFNDNIYELNGDEYCKQLTNQFNGVLSRLFNSEYKQLMADLRQCKKDGKKPSYSMAVAAMGNLSNYQRECAEYAEEETPIKTLLGPAYKGVDTDWNYVSEQMSVLKMFFSSGISLNPQSICSDFSSEQKSFANYAKRFEEIFDACDDGILKRVDEYFDAAVFDIYSSPCSLILERLNACLQEIDHLDNWFHFNKLLSALDQQQVIPYIHSVIDLNLKPEYIVDAFKKQFYRQWIDLIISETPALSSFNSISQNRAVQIFSEKDTEQFEINRAKIRATLSAKRPSLGLIAQGSAVSVLLREGRKKKKQKSVRSLLAETGELIQRIKPCFLMSPLSISTFLAPGAVKFDAVIFDEASQIFPQDAIGAIYRARQLIVVGDSKQMPPSNFFTASMDTEDSAEEIEDITDFESILDLCSVSMQQLRLRWHYRSQYEQLISFSNKHFYDGNLVTFPSSKADAPWIGVDYYHVDGTFDRKTHTNQAEAEFIVDLIFENISKYPKRSLGVVAFSVAQQKLIDKLLLERRQNDTENEFFFKDDNSDPFFIKNLETVQGDERDTIIFSIAYGRDLQGRLLHNFGPLNRVGGERRLNVAVTRAKQNIQIVSSMHYSDIDLNRSSAEGVKLLREYLCFAENGDSLLRHEDSSSQFEKPDFNFELEICDYLRSNGYSIDARVGCSDFRVDLALKTSDNSNYVLAIECDGDTYRSAKNARDRDRLRREVLERMGWQYCRVWSTDWVKNKSAEQLHLLEIVSDAVKKSAKTKAESESNGPVKVFEGNIAEKGFEFQPYKVADIQELKNHYSYNDIGGLIKAVLEVEAPMAEELLLRRIARFLDREKVTKVVRRTYEQEVYRFQRYGITREDGFLYLDNADKIQFRRPGDITRDIKQIAPEELAAGMLEILKQNVTISKESLYHILAEQCGAVRVGKTTYEAMDSAVCILSDAVIIKDDILSLK